MQDERAVTTLRDIWRLTLAVISVVAIVQELRKPKDERTWHGKVASFVPYDFRVPTVERIRTTYWDPDGAMLGGKVFGVGWAPNFGAVVAMLRRTSEGSASNME